MSTPYSRAGGSWMSLQACSQLLFPSAEVWQKANSPLQSQPRVTRGRCSVEVEAGPDRTVACNGVSRLP
ncbi:hypothetical protein E4T38_00845 [Aureobasidium subglaciale]|nr:hypothetical protein E4T38_00845 [Aureobasidium subglaciale]KAI5230732.1 hypothetical protein E4T40_00846 [Aureobasidium subglaciale]KAI5233815.1 hypothetical protein E4T41_00844 [Aureobasidium subglaciale]KAI5267163.1 hypothetical protein E4T46_00844 [Aureobasidium subglaciale]